MVLQYAAGKSEIGKLKGVVPSENLATWGDNPRDNYMIRRGFEYYHGHHLFSKGGFR